MHIHTWFLPSFHFMLVLLQHRTITIPSIHPSFWCVVSYFAWILRRRRPREKWGEQPSTDRKIALLLDSFRVRVIFIRCAAKNRLLVFRSCGVMWYGSLLFYPLTWQCWWRILNHLGFRMVQRVLKRTQFYIQNPNDLWMADFDFMFTNTDQIDGQYENCWVLFSCVYAFWLVFSINFFSRSKCTPNEWCSQI